MGDGLIRALVICISLVLQPIAYADRLSVDLPEDLSSLTLEELKGLETELKGTLRKAKLKLAVREEEASERLTFALQSIGGSVITGGVLSYSVFLAQMRKRDRYCDLSIFADPMFGGGLSIFLGSSLGAALGLSLGMPSEDEEALIVADWERLRELTVELEARLGWVREHINRRTTGDDS